ncbi:hypothetical protein EYS10_12680 [Rahnella aquatilis]|nr:hypothetical protein EYS10_12680 [Rahnella aquatilis]
MVTVPFVAASDVDTASMVVTATIFSPACTMALSPNPLPPLDVESAILRTGTVSPPQKVTLSLSKCGIGYAAKRPVVILSGTHPDPAELSGTDADMAFKDVGDTLNNTAQGFWIVVGRTQTLLARPLDLYSEGEEVFSGLENTRGDEAGAATSDLFIGVSCMNTSPCGKQAGSLRATLRFTFKYQ